MITSETSKAPRSQRLQHLWIQAASFLGLNLSIETGTKGPKFAKRLGKTIAIHGLLHVLELFLQSSLTWCLVEGIFAATFVNIDIHGYWWDINVSFFRPWQAKCMLSIYWRVCRRPGSSTACFCGFATHQPSKKGPTNCNMAIFVFLGYVVWQYIWAKRASIP